MTFIKITVEEWKKHYTPNRKRKFTIEQIFNIRERRANGELYKRIAKEYNVNESTIRAIVEYKTYRDIY